MVIRGFYLGLGALVSAGAVLLGAQSISTPAPPRPSQAIQAGACTVSGAKFIQPGLDDAAICARFMAAVGPVSGVQAVALAFLPQGVASAQISHTRAGQAQQQSFELAVSDRSLAPSDLDRLAADVVAGLARTGQ
jgi:hypothetical protein